MGKCVGGKGVGVPERERERERYSFPFECMWLFVDLVACGGLDDVVSFFGGHGMCIDDSRRFFIVEFVNLCAVCGEVNFALTSVDWVRLVMT